MRGPRLLQSLVLLLVLCCACGCSVTHAVRLSDREEIDVKSMVEEVSETPLIFVGELHDSRAHHRLQLEVIEQLAQQGKQVVIGMEMFEVTSQKALDAWVAGKVPEGAFIKLYNMSWRNIDWAYYEDIFHYARDHRIPILGLNAPRDIVQQVARSGFESLSPVQLQLLPAGATDQISQEYLEFIGAWYPRHGRSGESFRHICEAQALRNRVMAHTIRNYAAKYPERTLVVLAGAGHARHKGGVPMELPGADFRIIIPPIPGLTVDTITTDDADYLLLNPQFPVELF